MAFRSAHKRHEVISLAGLMVYMGRRTMRSQDNALSFGRTKARPTVGVNSSVTFLTSPAQTKRRWSFKRWWISSLPGQVP